MAAISEVGTSILASIASFVDLTAASNPRPIWTDATLFADALAASPAV